jgi:hypothetical protein
MNIEILRKAQRIVCENDFEQYRGFNHKHPNDWDGKVDDLMFSRSDNFQMQMDLDEYEQAFIQNPNYQTANEYWLASIKA